MNGFLCINKPAGLTSSDVVVKARKILGVKKIGHLGTLDPMATGVLPLAIGKATKLFDYFLNKTKQYTAEFTFGYSTDTLDSTGVVLAVKDVIPSKTAVCKALKGFLGEILQQPPAYSALSIGGVKAYKLAREGKAVTLEPRKVTIYRFELTRQINENTFEFVIECGSGTYIRALARDLAQKLDTLAVMSKLERTFSGTFRIDDSYTLEQLSEQGESCVVDMQTPLADIPVISIDDRYYDKLCNGNAVQCGAVEQLCRVTCKNEFFGLGTATNGTLTLRYNLR